MIRFSNVTKQYGQLVLYRDANFQINPGEKIGLVGPNGAGKTTLFRFIAKEESPDSGQIAIPSQLRIAYFSQDVGEMSGSSALNEVMTGGGKIWGLSERLHQLQTQLEESANTPLSEEALNKLLEEFGEVQHEFEQLGGYDLESRSKEILTGLGIKPEDHNLPLESFSGGWKMRIALAKVLVYNPEVLLMDEPTNHLDLESIIWLEEWLRAFKGSLLMTSHDRDFLNRLVSKIIEINHQQVTVFSGNYDFYEREKAVRTDQLLAAHKRQQDMIAKEEEFIARFAARASHAAQVQSRVKMLEKIERVEIPPEEREISFEFKPPPRSGNEVVKIENLAKVYKKPDSTEKKVFSNVSTMMRRLEKIAVLGVNGAGKSTLLKIISGHLEPSQGSVTIGASVNLGYFSQNSLDILDPQKTVLEEALGSMHGANLGTIRSLLGAFLFSGDDVNKKVSVLSGGEKSRLLLALMLASPVNFLVLDEPTNHLDIKSREILLNALKAFDGTIAFVSHDRYFLRNLANRVLEVDMGSVTSYDGSYEYYLSKTQRPLGLSH